MAGEAYATARLDELMRDDGWAPIRRSLGVASFGINAWTAREAGGTIIVEHDEEATEHEELYLVMTGRASFTVDGEPVDAPAGTIVLVRDPRAVRAATAVEAGTTVLSVGARPGRAFTPRSWETNRDVMPLFAAGRHAEARSLLLDALDRYQERADLFFNLACAEAQLGRHEEAIEHLRAAIEERPALAALAADDDDLEPLRAHPAFEQIVGGG